MKNIFFELLKFAINKNVHNS